MTEHQRSFFALLIPLFWNDKFKKSGQLRDTFVARRSLLRSSLLGPRVQLQFFFSFFSPYDSCFAYELTIVTFMTPTAGNDESPASAWCNGWLSNLALRCIGSMTTSPAPAFGGGDLGLRMWRLGETMELQDKTRGISGHKADNHGVSRALTSPHYYQ